MKGKTHEQNSTAKNQIQEIQEGKGSVASRHGRATPPQITAEKEALNLLFGAKAQISVGVFFLAATIAQTIYWETGGRRPDSQAIFLVSMEALAFAAYGIIATGLGYRKTEHVEAQVASVEHAEEVKLEGGNND